MVTQPTSLVTPRDYAARLEYLLDNSGLDGDELSELIGERSGYVSWVRSALRDKPPENSPKKVDPERAFRLATQLAGAKRVLNDQQALYIFLMSGDTGGKEIVRPTTGDAGDPTDGGETNAKKPSSTQTLTYADREAA